MPNTRLANITGLRFAEQANDISTPAASFSELFMKADGLRQIDDAGLVERMVVAVEAATKQQIIPANRTNLWIGDDGGSPSGNNNILLGQRAGKAATTGAGNVLVGVDCGVDLTEGFQNIGLGVAALYKLTTGANNVAIGDTALSDITTQSSNTGVGVFALDDAVGANNTALGYNAGAVVAGDAGVFLGYNAGSQETAGGKLYISNSNTTTPLIYGDFSGGLTVTSQAAAAVGLKVEAHASQSADILQAGDVNGGNYLSIESDGTLKFTGNATVWDDIRVPGLTVTLGASAPDLGAFLGAGNLLTYLFDGATITEQVYFQVQMPHGYKEGSDIHPHVHWTATDANAGDVKWQLEYSWANVEDTFPAVTTIAAVDTSNGTAWDHQIASFAAISGTGKTLSSMLVCRLFRNPTDGADTYASDVALLEFDIHVEMDTIGSRAAFTK